ncbi:universal stress protein [Nitrospirillum pindoramense]|uniref:Nucleotide-binding universal stress UspA family protein n=1 Tax=Nitrospirillum amazonense TaxID=28077 RepID=A0A560GPG0_9PROT|nr:universal stress protein [Nitrospirillum amazonense]TWB35898.1 nucleotide-binding universal stress UspA family protein [Nitrospirillum amazonense]
MSYRKILSVLTGGAGDRAALAAAFALARRGGGHVLGLVPNPDPREAVPALGEGVSGALVEEIMTMVEQESRNHRTRAHQTFDAVLAEAGASLAESPVAAASVTGDFREVVGNQEDVAVVQARLADLSVMAQVAETTGGEALLMLEAILLDSARPLLVVPPAFNADAGLGRHIVIAWNGSRESAQAVAQALPLLTTAETVTVIAVETDKTDGAAGRDLAEYLGWHGVTAQVRQPMAEGRSVGALLLAEAKAADADLLVLGGYGHSRLREMILGGVTRHVLYNATLPVLLAH